MKLTQRRSITTWMMSPVSRAPSPPSPAGPVQDRAALEVPAARDQRQARQRLRFRPSQNTMASSGRMTHWRSAAWR